MNLSLKFEIKNFLSKFAIFIIVMVWLGTFFNNKRYKSERLIDNDIISYYAYLPAVFMEHDLSLKFLDDHTKPHPGKYWPETAPNGGRVIKTTMGLAVMYLPFFALGHVVANISGEPLTGYSQPYYFFLCFGTLIYSFIGLTVLRKLLLKWFTDGITALTLLCVYLGTNLFHYTIFEPLMSHAYIIFLTVLFLKFTIQWHENPSYKNSLLLGVVSGLMILTRPLTALFLIVFLFYNAHSIKSLREKSRFVIGHAGQFVSIFFMILLLFAPQMIYWNATTGQWLFNSYQNERFYFSNPHLPEALIGFRKGWLLYTPVMCFAVAGLFFLRKNNAGFSLSLPLCVIINIYFLSCWWAWWFGGSFGNRGYIDMYVLLSVPMAGCFTLLWGEKNWRRISVTSVAILLVCYQLFQTAQYHYGAINFHGMTREAYWETFLRLKPTHRFWEVLKEPDYEKAKKGME